MCTRLGADPVPFLSPRAHRLAHGGETLAADPRWCVPRMSGYKVCAWRPADPVACPASSHLPFQSPDCLICGPVSLMVAEPVACTSAIARQVSSDHLTGQAAARANPARFKSRPSSSVPVWNRRWRPPAACSRRTSSRRWDPLASTPLTMRQCAYIRRMRSRCLGCQSCPGHG